VHEQQRLRGVILTYPAPSQFVAGFATFSRANTGDRKRAGLAAAALAFHFLPHQIHITICSTDTPGPPSLCPVLLPGNTRAGDAVAALRAYPMVGGAAAQYGFGRGATRHHRNAIGAATGDPERSVLVPSTDGPPSVLAPQGGVGGR
jgi:hypothetical protein